MNRLNKLITAVRSVSSDNSMILKGAYERAFLKNLSMVDDWQDVTRSPYTKSDLVYVCISTTGKAISQVPFQFIDLATGKLYTGRYLDFLNKLIERPNPLMDQYSFIEAMVSWLLLEGNAYLIPFPDITYPEKIYVVSKKYVTPIRDNKNFLLGWRYDPSGRSTTVKTSLTVDFEPGEICPIWLWNPSDPCVGIAPLEAGKIAITSDYVASIYNKSFFKNSANPGGILSTEKNLGKAQFERLKGELQEEYGGHDQQGKLLLLDGGLKYSQRTLTQKDMEFKDLRNLNAERIIQIFGMKKSIISITDDLNRATAEAERKEWWQSTNLPIMRLITSAMNATLFWRFGVKIVFDTSAIEALQENLKDKVKIALDLKDLGYTTNEINDKLEMGFEEQPWRDKWWGSVNQVPLSDPIDMVEETPKQITEDEKDDVLLITQGFNNSVEIEKDSDVLWKNYIRNTKSTENKFEKKLKTVFYKMRKKSLDILDRVKTIKSPNDLTYEEFVAEMEELQASTSGLYAEALKIGIAGLSEEIAMGISWDLSDPIAVNFLRRKEMKITRVGQTIKKQLNIQLSEGLGKGETIEQLSTRIKSVFNASRSRAKTIARTEVIGSTNFGRFEGINRTRFKKKRWITAMDERVRSGRLADHKVMNGKSINVGDWWNTPGGRLRYPGDYMGAAANIINCRCIEVVIPSSYE